MTDYGSSILVGHHTPAIEARVTAPDEPSVSASGVREANLAAAYYQLGYGDIWGDARSETPDGALTFSAVWACVRVIAQTLASVAWHTYERGPAGRTRQEIEDDVSWLLGMQANPETTALEWRQVTLKDALTWGNGYSEIERTNGGRPTWLWRLDPDRVSPDRTSSGQLVYEVENGSGVKNTVMMPDAMYHLKGLGPDGLVGWSVVKMAATSIRLGKQTEKYGSDTFGRGIMPSGLLKLPGNVNDVQRKEHKRSFQEAYAGQRNAHGIIVLGGGAEFTPFTLPNDDMQFLSTRQFQVSDIARWYGVPPHKIGDLSRSTNNNIEEQGREFVTDCLGPWAARLETEANVKLYGRTSRGRRYTRLDLEPIQRGNSETQATTTAAKVNGGLWTPNEGRAYLGDHPLPGADVLLVQGAMTTLDRVVNPPEPPAPAAPPAPAEPAPAKGDKGTPADNRAELRRVFGGLLAEAYGRLYRVDADKAKRAANKGRLAEFVGEWYAVPAAVDRVAESLRSAFEALRLATGRDARGDVLLREAAMGHVVRQRADLLTRGADVLAEWESRPAQLAAEEIERALR
jgi:HK97 family phage portal protein